MPSPRLIVFDIDGTLVSTQGLGAGALARAVTEVFGVPEPFKNYSMAGRTDPQIVREAMAAAGVAADRIRRDLPRALALHEQVLDAMFREQPRGHLMPGIRTLLERLRADAAWRVGLLTGNVRHGARIKLSHFGIWDWFAFGAYGDDDENRNALPAVALRRARETLGIDFDPGDAFVVGDTVRDIACARAGGMKAVAVATGGNTYEALAAAKPDHLFRSFEDVADVVATLNNGAGRDRISGDRRK